MSSSDTVYEIKQLAGSSGIGVEEAVQNAIDRARTPEGTLRWFEVVGARGYIEKGKVSYWQVEVKIGIHPGAEEEKRDAGPAKGEKKPDPEKKEKSEEAGEAKAGNGGKYRCKVCGYIYDPSKGDTDNGVDPGTPFKDLPDDWKCPECGAAKDMFEKV
ncbi:MAG: hypothetical protein GF408_04950 [Candidatus Omnitrophica bacterium]|nr:hypothetical protein [Candidatus Omnitrophota bacterium]